MELQPKVQHYGWGKLGDESMVAKLLSSADPNLTVDNSKPYAELWIGTHPNGPSLIIERNVLLSDYINDNLDAIGSTVRSKFGIAVPFLLKVLSIRTALSIQAHPNKEHAEDLHKNFPSMYKDPNHKPELAIALTPFEALCGFRPVAEIKHFLKNLPELCQVLPKESLEALQQDREGALKQVFEALMICDKNAIADSLLKLLDRLETEDEATQSELLLPLLRRLHGDFPGDVGCLAPYLLNYLRLRPGEAIFLGPNLPHAYLSGDCVECMACSDNVVRAGLTPKHVDVPTLLRMLDYTSYERHQLLFTPQMEDEHSCVWRPPVPDFAVVKIVVPAGESYNTIIRSSPSLLVVTSGGGGGSLRDTEPLPARAGAALFLKASRQLAVTAGDVPVVLYQAFCNL